MITKKACRGYTETTTKTLTYKLCAFQTTVNHKVRQYIMKQPCVKG